MKRLRVYSNNKWLITYLNVWYENMSMNSRLIEASENEDLVKELIEQGVNVQDDGWNINLLSVQIDCFYKIMDIRLLINFRYQYSDSIWTEMFSML